MSLFIESIAIIEGEPRNLSYHQERVDDTFNHHFISQPLILQELIKGTLPESGIKYKLRVVYGEKSHYLEYIPYPLRPIQRLKVIHSDVEYSYKYEDRTELSDLREGLSKNEDILIVKEGLVTDSSYSNLVFKKGNEWYTPATPLLEGTKRAKLLDEGRIIPKDIHIDSLRSYESVGLINSMIDLGEVIISPESIS